MLRSSSPQPLRAFMNPICGSSRTSGSRLDRPISAKPGCLPSMPGSDPYMLSGRASMYQRSDHGTTDR